MTRGARHPPARGTPNRRLIPRPAGAPTNRGPRNRPDVIISASEDESSLGRFISPILSISVSNRLFRAVARRRR